MSQVARATFIASLILAVSACTLATSDKPRLNAAGATFVSPIMSKWAWEYDKARGVEVNYQAIGSGGGIQQMTLMTAGPPVAATAR